ncbi:hypothetical protein N7448_006707 [Penicillium atrosanguineum]|uniref:Uncharacterized protein n=1 Tax=Penicillium atrosanguineum TaxID=1132637 RepID=A0A9W9PTH9_9EURO|nr:Serine/threonine-protein kinase PKH2 [Penicillium atrosanguineum]KAJ5132549.1 hypothetical protein N7448_006707 [Penicillium atrosanguineum]KAJ5137237.1 hypothetical protein N7526_003470 [Penicillium atrosanguineum]KAJ5290215.1 Serine/threonine-protein kinase PKH2 [Penicillium atrosanguineum]KAJ5308039.1 hypothetical protein N7476_008695 [Penicillium atrosanguineum]
MAHDSPFYQIVGHPGELHFQLQSKTTPELTLRIPTNVDIAAVIEVLSNKSNSEFDKSISDATAEELQSIAQRWTTVNEPLTHMNFLVRHNEQPLGIAGLGWIGPVNSSDAEDQAERAGAAGVMLQPFARGKGYAYEALRVVFDYGLRQLGLVEIRLGSHSGNLPMKGLMEKKFGLQPAVGTEESVDQFGNNLLWVVKREKWLSINN